MGYKVSAVSGTRADYGLLKRILKRLERSDKIDLEIVVTGSHLEEAFGNTQSELIADGFSDYSVIPVPMGDDKKSGMARATGELIVSFADHFERTKPDLLLVLGDRYEVFAAVTSAHMLGVPVAHISGGDVTEGAVDDALRHSVTKMSQIHFPGCEQSRKRIIQMGEEPDRVFNVGEPGVENSLKTEFLTREELRDSIDFDGIRGDYAVVTFHPVTLENDTGVDQVAALIRAMDDFPDMSFIVTLANADAGGRSINELWNTEGRKRDNWLVVPSLGVTRYLSAVKYSRMVLGNSSSGIVEAPSMGIPTVNIGDRQKGRLMADSVLTCAPEYEAIRDLMRMALQPGFQEAAKQVVSPYGDGRTSELIEKRLLEYLEKRTGTTEKHFYDIDFQIR